MRQPTALSIAESLILARLLPVGGKGETVAKVGTDLKPLLGGAEPADAVAELKTKGLIEGLPAKGKTKKPSGKVQLTEEGRAAALDFLGLDALPPKTTWPTIRKAHLALRALGLPVTAEAIKKFGKDPALKPALLKHAFALPIDGTPTLTQATDALTWRLLGLEPAGTLSVKAIQKALFHRALGDPGGKPIEPAKAVDHLVAKELGATSADPKKFRDALVLKWIEDADRAEPLELPAFAERVKKAATACKTGRFGDDKVFVVHVWRALKDTREFRNLDFPAFKAKLAEANNLRLLDLARADLAPAMNPEDVGLSEIQHLGATYHFIRLE